ncbi:MAG: type II toxin-antitoxin system VapC family toxin [Candidatus Rokuibacteriota bacterium]
MSRIFWDTNLFIYLFEDHGERSGRVTTLRERMLARSDQLCTSAFTLGEVLVKPLEQGNEELRRRYEAAFSQAVVLIPFDRDVAGHYAAIRRDRTIRAPDAIQLACAAHARVDLFITNDDRLSRCTVPGVQFVSSLERAFV